MGFRRKCDPVIVGNSVIISIRCFDTNGINFVYIIIDGYSYVMDNQESEEIWEFTWNTVRTGLFNYTIYVEDNYNNWDTKQEILPFIE